MAGTKKSVKKVFGKPAVVGTGTTAVAVPTVGSVIKRMPCENF